MLMRLFLTVVIVACGAAAAWGQPIDPSPDGIGIFFDEGGRVWCATATPGTQLTAYLCLTRASDTSDFLGWEARIECSVPRAVAGYAIRGDGVNQSTAPDFLVSYSTPLPYQLSTVLLEISLDVVWEWSIALRVWPAENGSSAVLPAYVTTAEPAVAKTLQYLWGWEPATQIPNWLASVNDPSCATNAGPSVPVDGATWGGIRALYR
jgi:hypothetical protein